MVKALLSKQQSRLERNVRLYPWYMAFFQAYCWLPIFFLFFLEKLPLEQVLWLESIFFFSVVVLETPSGYFSDKVGRRVTLIVSAVGMVSANGLFFYGATVEYNEYQVFIIFAVAKVLLAVGSSFKSGTDTVLHYDSLNALGRESEYARREAVAGRYSFLSSAIAALVGGAVASFELRFAYAASFMVSLIALAMVWSFMEPVKEKLSASVKGFTHQLLACVSQLSNPTLAWLFSFSLLMIVLNHLPYEFYQPYISLLGTDSEFFSKGTPMTAGIHTALTMLVAAWVAGKSIRLRDRIGLGGTLLITALIQLTTIAMMSIILHPIVALLLIARSTPRALMTAPLNAAITPQIPQSLRATYLSIQSLVGRLSFAGLLALLALTQDQQGGSQALGIDWQAMASMLRLCAWLGLLGVLLLIVTAAKSLRLPKA
jgi:hypothetical protein